MPTKSTFYKDTIPRLVEKYKIALEDCLDIVGQKIDTDLNDDKIFNALKGRKEAGEQVKFYAQQIDALENELNNIPQDKEEKQVGAETFTEE